MNLRYRKLLALLVALTFCFTLMPITPLTVMAETVSVATFDQLTTAIDNASEGDVIQLTDNIVYTSIADVATFSIDKNLTIDLNGMTLEYDGESTVSEVLFSVDSSCELIIKNGTINVFNTAAVTNFENSFLSFENCVVTGKKSVSNETGFLLILSANSSFNAIKSDFTAARTVLYSRESNVIANLRSCSFLSTVNQGAQPLYFEGQGSILNIANAEDETEQYGTLLSGYGNDGTTLRLGNGATANITNCNFKSLKGDQKVIYINGAVATISDCSFTKSGSEAGYGVEMLNSTLTLNNTKITSGYKRGIVVKNNSTLILNNCEIGNSGGSCQFGVTVENSILKAENTIFKNGNKNAPVQLNNSLEGTALTDCQILCAQYQGENGAIMLSGTPVLKMSNCNLKANKSPAMKPSILAGDNIYAYLVTGQAFYPSLASTTMLTNEDALTKQTLYVKECLHTGFEDTKWTVIVEPISGAPGIRAKLCTLCGKILESEEFEGTGECEHVYVSNVISEATCTEDGLITFTCSKCGESHEESTPALGHDYQETERADATCTENGFVRYTCNNCGESYDEVIAASGHDYQLVVTPPTCTEDGFTTYTCTICGDFYTDNIVPATGHVYNVEIVDPLCNEDGYTLHSCVNGDDSFKDSIVAATGHKFNSEGVCTVCDYQKTDTEFTLSLETVNSGVLVTVDGLEQGNVTDTGSFTIVNGATVELTALETPELPFMFWTEANGKVRSSLTTYTFTMNGSRTLKAWFEDINNGTAVIYQNTNTSKEIIASGMFNSADEFAAHLVEGAQRYGFTFDNWELSVDEIKAKIGTDSKVIVRPIYSASKYQLTVVNGAIVSAEADMFEPGEKVTITADEPAEGKVFLYWQDSFDNIISQSKTIYYTMGARVITLTAVYGEDSIPVESFVTVNTDKDGNKILIYNTRYINPDYSILDYGLIYSISDNDISNSMSLDFVDGITVKATSLGTTIKNSGVLFNTITNPSDNVYLRGYVICEDSDGNRFTVYSSLVVVEG